LNTSVELIIEAPFSIDLELDQ